MKGDDDMIFTVEEIRKRLLPVMEKNHVNRAVLFGSYSKGEATENSDIDLMINSHHRGLDFVGLVEDIRERLDDKEVDVISDSEIIPNSLIDREIRFTGVELYAR